MAKPGLTACLLLAIALAIALVGRAAAAAGLEELATMPVHGVSSDPLAALQVAGPLLGVAPEDLPGVLGRVRRATLVGQLGEPEAASLAGRMELTFDQVTDPDVAALEALGASLRDALAKHEVTAGATLDRSPDRVTVSFHLDGLARALAGREVHIPVQVE